MHVRSSLTIAGLTALAAGALFVQGTACTVTATITSNDVDGGFPDSNTPIDTDSGLVDGALPIDAYEAGPPLGFVPSNINVSGVNFNALVDVTLATSMTIASDTDQSATLSTTTGGVTYLTVQQTDGSTVGVYVAKSWTIPTGVVIHTTGVNAIAFVALTTIDITGSIDANSAQDVAGAGATAPTATTAGGKGPGQNGSITLGWASGGGGFCGAGGAGGAYTSVPDAGVPDSGSLAPAGGTPYGVAAIIPLSAGSSGGTGLGMSNGAPTIPGAGGGAIQLVAGTSITIETGGVVSANGGGGDPSGQGPTVGNINGGAGGGSGGAILLESAVVSVSGTITANGGGGGGNSAAGQDGQETATPANGSGTGDGQGGNGSGGTTLAGAVGLNGSGALGTGSDVSPAGAGGGAGWIRINTTSGAATLGTAAVLSPASGTTCVSQGMVTP